MQSETEIQPIAGLLILVLIVCLLIPTGRIPMGDDANRAVYHRRSLASFPNPTELRAEPEVYFRALQKWYADRVGFSIRSSLIRRSVSFHLFKDSPVPNVQIGKTGMLFLTAHGPVSDRLSIEHSCPATDRWPSLYEKTQADWRRIQTQFRAKELDPYLLIFPSKKVLYPDYLPRSVPIGLRERCEKTAGRDAPIAHLARAFPNHVLDAYPVLYPHKDKPHFYPPENFHADGEAAARGVEAMISLVTADGTPYETTEHFSVRESKSDLSYLLGFSLANQIRQIVRFDPAELNTIAAYEAAVQKILGEPVWAKRYQNEAALRDKKVMLITNSFGIRAAPYFARHFKHVDAVSTNRLTEPEQHDVFFRQLVFDAGYDHVVFILHDESVFKRRLGKFVSGLE
ncbi:MAG: hypothetical protein AAFQ12_01255 [Pseudomonadota bacterium]